MVVLPRLVTAGLGRPLQDLAWVEAGLWTRAAYYVLFSQAAAWWQLFLLLALILPRCAHKQSLYSPYRAPIKATAWWQLFLLLALILPRCAHKQPLYSPYRAPT